MTTKIEGESKTSVPKKHFNKVWQMDDEKENNKVRRKHKLVIHYANTVFEIDDGEPSLNAIDNLAIQRANFEDMQVQVKDDVVEVDLRDDHKSMLMYICAHLSEE
ncbi:hypothetical protein ACH5RR_023455 [Cinchona calisaya]|uniref:Uncharacterized protein n=1 Tax=Cinchona calisaya TaxID=153742 RepID=A0ABD2ZAS9_9GENT